MPSILSHHVFFLLLLTFFAIAQSNRNLRVGETLTAHEAGAPWLSESGDFAFGFHQLNNKDRFLLAIWYNKIPDKTIVWHPNGINTAPRGSKVELTAELGLVLKNPQNEELWCSPFTGGAVAHGILNDTGNFVLVGGSYESLWESFGHPTDTLLPTQILERDGFLSSRHGHNNLLRGRFQFLMQKDGNAVLRPIHLPSNNGYDAYYISNTSDRTNESNSGYRVIFHKAGYFYIERKSGERYYLTREQDIQPASMYYHKATLNFDGVFTISQHPKNPTANDSWSDVRIIPDNICLNLQNNQGSGTCGFNSICSLGDNKRPICECPPRFSQIENDPYGSCTPDFPHGCEEDGKIPPEDLYEFVELQHTDWPANDFEVFIPVTLDDCKKSCLHDCLCAVFGYQDYKCWKKRLPLSDGRRDRQLGRTHFLKVRKGNYTGKVPPYPHVPNPKDQNTLIIAGSILLGSSVFVNFLLVGAFCLGFLFCIQKKLKGIHLDEGVAERTLRQFTYKTLEEVTNGFDKELGKGSCGIVYKGEVEKFPVAVKKLDTV